MQLDPIIQALRTRSATLGANVAGAAQFQSLKESVSITLPFAFVIPLDDNPGESRANNSVRQDLNDSFAVVVAFSNVADEKGQTGAEAIHEMRAELWSCLLGWRPSDRYNGITYEGGQLMAMDRARIWYQYEFGAVMEIEPSDGWQETELAALPHFDGATIRVDAVDPSDPNQRNPVLDGRYEAGAVIPRTGNLP